MLEVLALEVEDLPGIRKLMHQYADLPMDFADAALAQIAKRQRIETIFTLDRLFTNACAGTISYKPLKTGRSS